MIRKDKLEKIEEELRRLGIHDEDLIEKFILGSGSGGQKVNKTSSCVYLKHIPTGIEVKCQKGRSRELNRYYARADLCEKFKANILKEKTLKQRLAAKIRAQKKRRTRRQKEKMLEEKKKQSTKKALRRPPSRED